MKSKIESLVDLVNEFCQKETDEKVSYNDLTEILETSKDFPGISFVGDEENDSGEMVLIRSFLDKGSFGSRYYLPSLSDIEFQSEIDEIFEIFLKDYEEVLEKEFKREDITEWQIYYKEMFERIFSKNEIEILRSKYGKKSERDLFIREIYLRTENFYRNLLDGKLVNISVGPEVEDEFSRRYGLKYYAYPGEFEGLALRRGNKILESLSNIDDMPVIEDLLGIYLNDYLCVKEKIENGKEVSDTEMMYKILFEDFFSKEEIEELRREMM